MKPKLLQRVSASTQFLYHVTYMNRLNSIEQEGLQPDNAPSIGGMAYDFNRKGCVFLTDAAGVDFWLNRAENFAYDRADEPVNEGYVPVVLRIKATPELRSRVDETGTQDSGADAFAVEGGVDPDQIEYWNGTSWSHLQGTYVDDTAYTLGAGEDGYLNMDAPIFRPKLAAAQPAGKPMDRDSFNAQMLRNWKKGMAESNGWRSATLIHHGTDSITAQKIIDAGYFQADKDWPSFFTLNKKEAADYARMRAREAAKHNPEAKPYVFSLRVAPYAVSYNNGSNEVETHPLVPLYIRGNEGYIRDEDIIKSEQVFNPTIPTLCYDAYLKDWEQGGQESREMRSTHLDGDVSIPIVHGGNTVVGEKPLKDFTYWELLSTYGYLKRKRDKKSRELYKLVEAWGMRMQEQRKAEM